MLYAEKGNKVKAINESQIETCVEQGYKIVNEQGVLIRDTIPTGVTELRLAYKEHEKTINALKKANAELTEKIATLESELSEAKAQSADSGSKPTSKRSGAKSTTTKE